MDRYGTYTGDLDLAHADLYAPQTRTWTFVGHWDDSDHIVVEYVLDGEQQDDREDTGEHAGGLWADSATGTDVAETQARLIAQYDAATAEVQRYKL